MFWRFFASTSRFPRCIFGGERALLYFSTSVQVYGLLMQQVKYPDLSRILQLQTKLTCLPGVESQSLRPAPGLGWSDNSAREACPKAAFPLSTSESIVMTEAVVRAGLDYAKVVPDKAQDSSVLS